MQSKKQPGKPYGDEALALRYEQMVAEGAITDDPGQRKVLAALEELCLQLKEAQRTRGFFRKGPVMVRGLYIWGNVGRGKSMLADLFFDYAPVERKRRVHFHAFMQEVHARIHQLRQDGSKVSKDGADPVMLLARDIAQEVSLLCFDELQATDVADATLLYRLFDGLFAAGVTIVSTSNHPPATLYTGEIQRERFSRFITLIEQQMQVIALSSPADYRLMQRKSLQVSYFSPLGAAAEAFVEQVLRRLCEQPVPERDTIVVQGRRLEMTVYDDTIGRFTFHELCETALGAADYLALVKRLDTVILTGVPVLTPQKRNEAKRFVTLIDTLYESKTKLVCTAAAPPQELYPAGDGSFEFQRTVSRLMEMQSAAYGEHRRG
jgi:cell division protein ZapE